MKELDSGTLKKGSLHSREFWEENYKEFELSNFEYIRRLVKLLQNSENSDKQIVTVVYGKEKEGFFKYDSSLQPTIGMILSIRVQEVSQDGFMKVFSARECFDGFNSDCEYYKEIEGIVIYNEHKKIYSFKAGNIVCFIPSQYVENYSLERGQNIKSMILYSYNKKQDKWMWKLIGIVS